jgi:hypothetical protein
MGIKGKNSQNFEKLMKLELQLKEKSLGFLRESIFRSWQKNWEILLKLEKKIEFFLENLFSPGDRQNGATANVELGTDGNDRAPDTPNRQTHNELFSEFLEVGAPCQLIQNEEGF